MPKTHFLIVGDGPGRSELERLARDLCIASNVHFTGFRSDIPELLSVFDVSVLSSYPFVETFPLAILESMAAAKPVVATDVGSLSDMVVQGETGFLVPPDHPEALAQAILLLLKDKTLALKMAEAGRKRVENNFTIERMVFEHEALFERLMERDNPVRYADRAGKYCL